MARNRMIKPEFWTDSKTGTLSGTATKLFIGLLNFSDDYGYIRYDLTEFKSKIFPFIDNKEVSKTIGKALVNELLPKGLVVLIKVDGKGYLFIPNFTKHQKVDHPSNPIIPGSEKKDFVKSLRPTSDGKSESSRKSSGGLAKPREPSLLSEVKLKKRKKKVNNKYSIHVKKAVDTGDNMSDQVVNNPQHQDLGGPTPQCPPQLIAGSGQVNGNGNGKALEEAISMAVKVGWAVDDLNATILFCKKRNLVLLPHQISLLATKKPFERSKLITTLLATVPKKSRM